jgi:hypothetical protein
MILFENIEYKTREITLKNFGNVLISEEILNDKLMNINGAYFSDEALRIDEKIFFFVNSFDIDLPDEKLVELILKDVK